MARPFLCALLAAAFFGITTPASKLLSEPFGPFQLAGLLYLGAALGTAPFAGRGLRWQQPMRASRPERLRLLGAVVAGGLAGPLLLLCGLRLAQAASVALWLNFELAATALLGALCFRDPLGRVGWLGVASSLAGGLLLAGSAQGAGPGAGALVLLACLCWGFDNHWTALIRELTPQQITFWKGLVAGGVNAAIGFGGGAGGVDAAALAGALAIGALGYGASIALYIEAARGLGATRAQLVFSSAPLFGVAGSVLWLGEPLTPAHFGAALIFAAGIALLFAERHAHAHRHAAIEHEHAHRHDDGHHDHGHDALPAGGWHSHRHQHADVTHAHPHWPDLHHRHAHAETR